MGGGGWNNTAVTVGFTYSDGLSGLTGCGPDVVLEGEGGGQSATGTATDAAGNVATAMVEGVNIDRTAPAIACAGPDGLWHASDVTVACSAADLLSGLAEPGAASFALVTAVSPGVETADAATGSGLVCDRAGNCGIAGPVGGHRVDKRPPSITISSPLEAMYTLGAAVGAGYACSDDGAGMASCAGPVPSGDAIDTASVGAKLFTVQAADTVGNTASATVPYSVGYGLCLLYDTTRAVRSGSTISIRFRLCDAAGANVSHPETVVTAVGIVYESSDTTDPVEDAGNANPDDNFRYEASSDGGSYIYNLSTRGLVSGTYRVLVRAGGAPAVQGVPFQVR